MLQVCLPCLYLDVSIRPLQGRYEFLTPKRTSLSHRLETANQGFVDFVGHLLSVDPSKRPTAEAALQHPWLQLPYESDIETC